LSLKTEKNLRTAYRQGRPLELGSAGPDSDPRLAINGGAERTIRASVIHDLLLSKPDINPGQLRQLRITGAVIVGPLDLQFAQIDCPVIFTHCTFKSQLRLSEAQVRSMSLCECFVPGMDASHVTVTGDLNLDRVWVTGRLQLAGAHVTDDLHLEGATITAASTNAALDLANIHVQGNIEAKGLTVHGKVSTNGASIDGVLTMRGAKICAVDGSAAWDGDGMKIGGELDATGLRANGQVRLVDARVLNLALRRISIKVKNSDSALLLDRLKSQGSVLCDQGRIIGGIRAIGIQVDATLNLTGTVAQIRRAPGATGKAEPCAVPAVNLSRAKITGDLYCEKPFQSIGRFDLTGARIGGQVSLNGASLQPIDNANGSVAFKAERSEIGSDLYCDGNFHGTMILKRTQVRGAMTINQHDEDPHAHFALAAEGLQVARSVDLQTTGKIDLAYADIAENIKVDLARLDDREKGIVADLSAIKARNLILSGTLSSGFLDLTDASVGMLLDDPDKRPPGSQIMLDGFVYGDIVTPAKEPLRYRLDWLKAGTASRKTSNGYEKGVEAEYEKAEFISQPYTQLAAIWQRTGHDRESRLIMCHMHREHNKAVTWHRLHSKMWNWIQDIFIGYGYVPSRALLWLIVMGGLAAAWFTNSTIFLDAGKTTHIGVIEAVILSLGLVLPGTRYDTIEKWQQMNVVNHVIAAGLVLCGLLLGATVLAALARIGERRTTPR
jgi:hypothetical protein